MTSPREPTSPPPPPTITHLIRDHETHGPPPSTRWILFSTFLGPPVLWATHLQIIYPTVDLACLHGITWPFYVSATVTLALTILAGASGQHQRRHPRGNTDAERERSRFLGTLGLANAAIFAVLIAAQTAALFVFEPCLR